MANVDCTVLVTSCDAYRDVEEPFVKLFRKYWPDCPFELAVNGETGAAEGFDRVLLSGRGKTWSQMLVEALDQIAAPYVILLMNDYYLASRVETARMLSWLGVARSADALNLRLCPDPPGETPFDLPADLVQSQTANDGDRRSAGALRLFASAKNKAYAVSCKAGIWNRRFLRDLAARTRSAWEFERRGSYMFDESDPRPLLVTETQEFPFLDVVHKGYWEPWAVDFLRREGLDVARSARGLPPWRVRAKEWLKKAVFNLNPDLVTRIQNTF